MNKLFILCGMVFLGITSTPQSPESKETETFEGITPVTIKATLKGDKTDHQILYPEVCEESVYTGELSIADIAFEEAEEPIELGFDTSEYLPEGFDPYDLYVDFSSIPFIEESEGELVSGTLKVLLPEGFNAWAAPDNAMDISYMEEEDLDLGFDTKKWLPEGFDAYSRELDLDTITYLEDEEVELGFDTSLYLPENFDPYSL